jgi:hypothetical protein
MSGHRKRGDFIREKMGLSILRDLGAEKINAEQSGDVDDLMRDLSGSGTTCNLDLARNEYYLRAVQAWKEFKRGQGAKIC